MARTNAKKNFKTALARTTDEVKSMIDVYDWAYKQSTTDLRRLEDQQKMYDNTVDVSEWPTIANIPLPTLFVAVERALPGILAYLFPKSKMIRLNSLDRAIPIEELENTEWALQHTVTKRVQFPYYAIPTIKDALKLGLGYGHIDTVSFIEPQVFTNVAFSEGEEVARETTLGLGDRKKRIRYRYVSVGQIVVTPDGTDFNGNDAVSSAFYLDLYREQDFRDMYDGLPDVESPELTGNADAIIEEARSIGFNNSTSAAQVMAIFAGYNINLNSQDSGKKVTPVMVPVLKVYESHKHTWLANGTKKIFQQENKLQTMMKPLFKCSAHPDGHRWYPMNSAEAAAKPALGMNIFINAIFDLLTNHLKPTMVYDKTKTGDGAPERGPNSDIGVTGTPRDAISYLENPAIPQGLFTVNDLLAGIHGSAMGQESFLNEDKPGLMRAGAGAFESVLAQKAGREIVGGAIMEMGFIRPVIEQILIYMQLNADESGDSFVTREWNADTSKEYQKQVSITREDLTHVFELELDLEQKHRMTSVGQQQRMTEYNAFKEDIYMDAYEVRMRTFEDAEEGRRVMKSREEVARLQEEQRQAQLAEQQAAQANPQAATEGEQAQIGRESQQPGVVQ